MSLMKGL